MRTFKGAGVMRLQGKKKKKKKKSDKTVRETTENSRESANTRRLGSYDRLKGLSENTTKDTSLG